MGKIKSSRSPYLSHKPKDPHTLSLTKMRQQWEEEMERLNTEYNLDSFSDSELDSESDEGEQYQYEHEYENTNLKNSKEPK